MINSQMQLKWELLHWQRSSCIIFRTCSYRGTQEIARCKPQCHKPWMSFLSFNPFFSMSLFSEGINITLSDQEACSTAVPVTQNGSQAFLKTCPPAWNPVVTRPRDMLYCWHFGKDYTDIFCYRADCGFWFLAETE